MQKDRMPETEPQPGTPKWKRYVIYTADKLLKEFLSKSWIKRSVRMQAAKET